MLHTLPGLLTGRGDGQSVPTLKYTREATNPVFIVLIIMLFRPLSLYVRTYVCVRVYDQGMCVCICDNMISH